MSSRSGKTASSSTICTGSRKSYGQREVEVFAWTIPVLAHWLKLWDWLQITESLFIPLLVPVVPVQMIRAL